MSNRLQRLLDDRPWLLADGATGTNYFAAGLETGDAPEPAPQHFIPSASRGFQPVQTTPVRQRGPPPSA